MSKKYQVFVRVVVIPGSFVGVLSGMIEPAIIGAG